MIKQVIDGKAYNTETARCLATVELMGYRTDARGRSTTNTPTKVGTSSLYETRGGGYFLVRDYDSASDIADPDLAGQLRIHDRGVTPLKRKEALGWAESKALDSDKIEEIVWQGRGGRRSNWRHPAARAADAQVRHREVRCRSRCIDQHLAHALCRTRHCIRTRTEGKSVSDITGQFEAHHKNPVAVPPVKA
jgi:hypothetical protein